MVNLAENGVVCECGSKRLAPTGDLNLGSVVICSACARCFRVGLALTEARWSEVEDELRELPYDLQAFEWTRGRVAASERRTLAELADTAPSRRPERIAVVLSLVLFLLCVLTIIRAAVHS